jgi:FkbM family methyltransferase
MLILYGTENINIDVTKYCLTKLVKNNVIYIPENDVLRANIFGDPVINVLKSIFITDNLGITKTYTSKQNIYINVITGQVVEDNDYEAIDKLKHIHNVLKLDYGSFSEEYPEQIMATKFLKGNEKVLEIGGNIGRNSLVIAHILNSNGNNNFVSLECSDESAQMLTHNKNLNKLQFQIEPSALSKRNLIQRNWDTIQSNVLLDGYKHVNTINWDTLCSKYNITFDTLILDCEGAFYYILLDMPEILDNITLIMMENDYVDFNKKKIVNNILESHGFSVCYSREGGWGPCYCNFYEVWKKYS